MKLPRWAQWLGGASVVGGIGALLAFRDRIVAAALLSVPAGASSAPVPSTIGAQPSQLTGDPILLLKGRTYFAVLHTTGVIDAAANPDRVKSEGEKQGFRDVFVSKARPQFFPGSATGDYYVRATYAGDDRDIARKQSVFLGSVSLLDAWIAAP